MTLGRTLFYIFAVFCALILQGQRVVQERKNHTVEMVLDYSAASDYARSRGKDLKAILQEYRDIGVNSLVFSERKWEDLEGRGIAGLYSGLQLAAMWPDVELRHHIHYNNSYVVVFQPEYAAEIEKQLKLGVELPPPAAGETPIPDEGSKVVMMQRWPQKNLEGALPGKLKASDRVVFEVALPVRSMQSFGLGYSDEQIKPFAKAGYNIWLRPENRNKADAQTVTEVLTQASKMDNVQGFIFGGMSNESPGFPDALDTTIDFLKSHKLKLGFIELPKASQQKGMESIVRGLPEQTVRVFAVSPQQQSTLKPERLAQMYGLAARERNARVLYIRPYPYDPSPDKGFEHPNDTFRTLLADDLKRHMDEGQASTFSQPVSVSFVLAAIISAGVMCVFWKLLDLFFKVPRKLGMALCIGLPLVTAVACLTPYSQFYRTLLAFASAGIISLYAIVHLYDDIDKVARLPRLKQVWHGSSSIWLRMTFWSLSGALLASSLLQETSFKLGLDTFRGVKPLTVGVPMLAVVAWFARKGNWRAILEVFRTRIRLYHLVGFAFLAVVGVFYAIRSGNTGGEVGGDALEAERYVRMYLDNTLGVRPRFKEFLIAHPAMLLAPFAMRLGGPYMAWIFILAGATGQVGLPDTFAHIHTPIIVSLIRTLMGAAFGWLVALCIIGPIIKLRRFFNPKVTVAPNVSAPSAAELSAARFEQGEPEA